MNNYNRMTIREVKGASVVLKMKRARVGGYATDGAGARFEWFVSAAARPLFTGTRAQCVAFIEAAGAEVAA